MSCVARKSLLSSISQFYGESQHARAVATRHLSGTSACLQASASKDKAKDTGAVINKTELTKKISDATHVKALDVEMVLSALQEHVMKLTAEGKAVRLRGFGSFSCAPTAARTARNPKTGERVDVPESRRIRFTASKNWKDAIKTRR
eukprot:TRINITY_DN10362_c0_g1_i6.p1 TRINITY_DN10362_c0_g1~~TRINITY_DN10362_c0_g1_i6.p1  ORF type:complete len:147 (-),score=13.25 TRINITY_DN10362_c0_g1_i6:349-789(-)